MTKIPVYIEKMVTPSEKTEKPPPNVRIKQTI